jgi:hypothetical protein
VLLPLSASVVPKKTATATRANVLKSDAHSLVSSAAPLHRRGHPRSR